MAIKKSELYSSLWQSCDELRGGMDASQYKDYVLVLLFIKYISDKYAGKLYAPIKIPEGASFADMVALKGKTDIGDQINKKVIAPLANENTQLSQADFPDFNDPSKLGTGREMVQRLTNLIAIFESPALDFSTNRADGDDILGDAYEYLMRHFATESGKSKGQFYTPAEVSRIMAQILGIHDAKTSAATTVYDPTCGSGSLLLKVGDEAGTPHVSLYGQEKDQATSGLARMNMVLHSFPAAEIRQGNTLTDPKLAEDGNLKMYDYVVANPPFSDKRWSTGLNPAEDPHERFKSFGTPPAKQGDYAYLLHIARSLKSTGKGACILPHGVLFRGNAEAEIRRNLVRKGYIKGIIGLPANLFYGTGIPACIVMIDKEGAQARKGIFMIDASSGFMKDGPKNRLRAQDIHKIVDVFNKRVDVPKYARMVPTEEIERNEFNLNLPRYIDSQVPKDLQDIAGHLQGGIPVADVDALERYWAVCPGLRNSLFVENRPGYVDLAVEALAIKTAIYEHPEFATFLSGMNDHFAAWRQTAAASLKNLQSGFQPKTRIKTLAEGLLTHYGNLPLIDAYDIYQHLMNYWDETMQDDAYVIASDGWKAETHRVIEKVKTGKKKGQDVDRGWACDLVPKEVVVARCFGDEQARIDQLSADLESASAKLTELEEEQGGEEGTLRDVENKTDANGAREDAVDAIWAEQAPEEFARYATALAELGSHEQIRVKLEAGEYIQPLANARGMITQSCIKKRLKAADDPKEREALEQHEAESAAIRALRKETKEFREAAEQKVAVLLEAKHESEDLSDIRVLDAYLALIAEIAGAKKAIKEASTELDDRAYAQYPKLTEAEIKTLVVEDKWMAALEAAIHSELDRISQLLTQRVKELTERYATPLPQMTERVDELESRVNAHLQKMGFSWQ